ncbi:MAG: hypothetical protein J5698_04350 [Bacteroidaceae bacterium]|nr:hypothetical protein [Bacteroidaceae bacterium]
MSLRKLPKKVVWKIRSTKFLRDVVMSVIGTTISIALTFGTAEMKNAQKKKKDGRATVMMVVHDIDESVKEFRELAEYEEANHEVALFAMSHIDELGTLSDDTITQVVEYLLQGVPFDIDDSNEKIFQSSQDAWKNIANKSVIDLIQDFYRDRHIVLDYIKTNILFMEPITKEKEYELLLKTPEHYFFSGNADKSLKETFKSDEVDLYMLFSPARQKYYADVANSWQRISDQCKFMMSITDDEMRSYIESTQRTGFSITRKKLIGKWIVTSTSDLNRESIELLHDNTFVHIKVIQVTSNYYSGRLTTTLTMPGTWEISGDSLVRNYAIGARYEMDTSEISYTDEMTDSVKSSLAHMQEQIDEYNEKAAKESPGRRANLMYIDKSGNKIEMHTIDSDEKETTQYLVRETEKESPSDNK